MNGYGQYQKAYKTAAVSTSDQGKLIVMLYDGAIKNINMAVERMKMGELERSHQHFLKSKNIVSELMSSLNHEEGGEISENLKSLYSYMYNQLIDANVNKDEDAANLVLELLAELKSAWVSISGQNVQPSTDQKNAMKKISVQG